MSEIPSLEQMLKLWSKKDLWNRIQEKNQRIAELEEQLKNVIPFKTGQILYNPNKRTNCIYELSFEKFMYKALRLKDGYVANYSKEEIFATKEEAEQRLKELKGE